MMVDYSYTHYKKKFWSEIKDRLKDFNLEELIEADRLPHDLRTTQDYIEATTHYIMEIWREYELIGEESYKEYKGERDVIEDYDMKKAAKTLIDKYIPTFEKQVTNHVLKDEIYGSGFDRYNTKSKLEIFLELTTVRKNIKKYFRAQDDLKNERNMF